MKSAAFGWKRRMTRRGYVRCGSGSGTVRRRRRFCAQPAGTLQRWQSCWRIRAYPAPQKLALLQTLGEKDLRDVRPAVLREALDAGGGVSPSG